MGKKNAEITYTVTSKYGVSSPTDFRRLFSDLISRAIDANLYEHTPLFHEVYQHAARLSNGCCFYCDAKLAVREGNNWIIPAGVSMWDHFVPASRYGLFIMGNVVLACVGCNLSKSAWSAEEYWVSRVENNLPLRYKTRSEFDAVSKELADLERVSNVAKFYPSTDEGDESALGDILVAARALAMSDIAEKFLESYNPTREAEWLRFGRVDADILAQLSDRSDEAGLYARYAKTAQRSCGFDARSDVRARVSRFVRAVSEVAQVDDVRALTPETLRAVSKFYLAQLDVETNGEHSKYKRLVRVLAEHDDLAHLKDAAWDDSTYTVPVLSI